MLGVGSYSRLFSKLNFSLFSNFPPALSLFFLLSFLFLLLCFPAFFSIFFYFFHFSFLFSNHNHRTASKANNNNSNNTLTQTTINKGNMHDNNNKEEEGTRPAPLCSTQKNSFFFSLRGGVSLFLRVVRRCVFCCKRSPPFAHLFHDSIFLFFFLFFY